jgi:glycosyltransferase involved in cell wall biosynthesis
MAGRLKTDMISIVTPFYNIGRFLEETIESVLRQTYTGWELLLVDDGSTDGSTQTARRYAETYPGKIKYLEHPGHRQQGVAASRNLAVANAAGDYLALLDADDCWFPGKLAFQAALAEKFPHCALFCGASLYWYSWADGGKEDVLVPVGGPQDSPLPPGAAATILYPLGKGAAPCTGSILVRKDVVLKYNGFETCFAGVNQVYEDQAFLIKIYLEESIYISSRAFDKYRQRPGSQMDVLKAGGGYRQIREFFLRWLTEYLGSRHGTDPQVRRALRKAQLPYKHPLWFKIKQCLR